MIDYNLLPSFWNSSQYKESPSQHHQNTHWYYAMGNSLVRRRANSKCKNSLVRRRANSKFKSARNKPAQSSKAFESSKAVESSIVIEGPSETILPDKQSIKLTRIKSVRFVETKEGKLSFPALPSLHIPPPLPPKRRTFSKSFSDSSIAPPLPKYGGCRVNRKTSLPRSISS